MQYSRGQEKAIHTVQGTVQVIAGPGAGKTFTLVERVFYMLHQGISASQICILTFTHRAAQEIFERLYPRCCEENIRLDDLYIGNFHTFAQYLLERCPDKGHFLPGWKILDPLGQKTQLQRAWSYLFQGEANPAVLRALFGEITESPSSYQLQKVTTLCDQMREGQFPFLTENLDVDDARKVRGLQEEDHVFRDRPITRALQALLMRVRAWERKENAMPFSAMLEEACFLLSDPECRKQLAPRFQYFLVDEYQDTNPIQEQMLAWMASTTPHQFVVGDDDQSLYRFRGARVENFVEFAHRYPETTQIFIQENHRSKPDIVERALRFIEFPHAFVFSGKKMKAYEQHRVSKALYAACPHPESQTRGMYYLSAKDAKAWTTALIQQIRKVHAKGVPYAKIAILSHSLWSSPMRILAQALERAGIPYTKNERIRVQSEETLQLMLRLLCEHWCENGESWAEGMTALHQQSWFQNLWRAACAKEDTPIQSLMRLASLLHSLQEMLQARRFFYCTQEERHHVWNTTLDILNKENLLVESPQEGLAMMTIHQSKGLEYEVVFLVPMQVKEKRPSAIERWIDEEWQDAFNLENEAIEDVLEQQRLYYTAMTRAKRRLYLTSYEHLDWVQDFAYALPSAQKDPMEDLMPLDSEQKKSGAFYSYTADLAIYMRCPRLYFYQRVLGFPQEPTYAAEYGTLIHRSLQLMHRMMGSYMQKNSDKRSISVGSERFMEYLKICVERVYAGLKAHESLLHEEDLARALLVLQQFFEKQGEDYLQQVKESEKSLRTWEGTFGFSVQLDAIYGTEKSIWDFKTGKVPDAQSETLKQYQKQVQFYRALLGTSESQHQDGLYFVEENIWIPVESTDPNAIRREMKEIVHRIENKRWEPMEHTECEQCPLQNLCRRQA